MTTKYKILVLTNLNDNLKSTLKNAIKFAQALDGKINVLHVQKPSDLVKKESQLSALRNIYSRRITADKKIRGIIDPISDEFGIGIYHKFVAGNVKNEIAKYLDQYRPDLVIMGKPKNRSLNFMGDRISDFVLNHFPGEVLIATDQKNFGPNKEFSIGTLDDVSAFKKSKLTKLLFKETNKPMKSFKFKKKDDIAKEESFQKENTTEFVFERNQNTIEKLPNYLNKNNINLFMIKKNGNKDKTYLKSSDIKGIIRKVNVPLLMVDEKKIA